MEFGDTEAYRVSKEAQKMQSEVKTRVCVCVCVHTLGEPVSFVSWSELESVFHTHLNKL